MAQKYGNMQEKFEPVGLRGKKYENQNRVRNSMLGLGVNLKWGDCKKSTRWKHKIIFFWKCESTVGRGICIWNMGQEPSLQCMFLKIRDHARLWLGNDATVEMDSWCWDGPALANTVLRAAAARIPAINMTELRRTERITLDSWNKKKLIFGSGSPAEGWMQLSEFFWFQLF